MHLQFLAEASDEIVAKLLVGLEQEIAWIGEIVAQEAVRDTGLAADFAPCRASWTKPGKTRDGYLQKVLPADLG